MNKWKRDGDCYDLLDDRRRLRREDKEIGIGEKASGKDQDTLYTPALATCMGVAIVGTWKDGAGQGKPDRWISHSEEEESDNMEAIVDEAKDAAEEGLGDVHATFVYPDPDSFTDEKGFTDDNRKSIQVEIDYFNEWLEDFPNGITIDRKPHPFDEIWALKVNSDRSVSAGTNV